MSVRYSQSDGNGHPSEDDDRSFTTGIGSMVTPAEADEEEETAPPVRPTFTAKPSEPAAAAVPEPAPAPDDATAPDVFAGRDVASDPEFATDADVATDTELGSDTDLAGDTGLADDTDLAGDPDLAGNTGLADDTDLAGGPERTVPATPAVGLVDAGEPALGPDDGTYAEPDVAPEPGLASSSAALAADPGLASDPGLAADSSLAADEGGMRPQPLAATPGLDEPLLSDVDGLRARWQRAQADFVDDPREAVGEAADLIEQTAQAMVGALRQRQRQLRVMWESGPSAGPADGTGPAADGGFAGGGSDTEHLRQMMMHYRTLFNQLCRP